MRLAIRRSAERNAISFSASLPIGTKKPVPLSRPTRPSPTGPNCFMTQSLSRHSWTACFIIVWSSTCGATATGFEEKSERREWKQAYQEVRVAHFSRPKMVHFEKTVDNPVSQKRKRGFVFFIDKKRRYSAI